MNGFLAYTLSAAPEQSVIVVLNFTSPGRITSLIVIRTKCPVDEQVWLIFLGQSVIWSIHPPSGGMKSLASTGKKFESRT